MKRTARLAILALVIAACGGKGDECQQLMSKMEPIMKEMGGGKDFSKEKDKGLADCRKNIDKIKSDPSMKCVLDASSEAAVRDCLKGAFGDYMKKSKKTEAALQLNKLGKHLKVYYTEKAEYPKGTAKTLPEGKCCDAPEHKCPVSTGWATDPVWSAIDFEIDEPGRFQYTYDSADGKTVKATAVGDVDCSGVSQTYVLTAKVGPDGNPAVDVAEPQ